MAQFCCGACGFESHYINFKLDPEAEAPSDEDAPDPDLECPECASPAVFEL